MVTSFGEGLKTAQPYNNLYTISNVTNNHVANSQLIDLTGDIPDSYENTAK